MTAYSRGANFERRVKKHLEDKGWICFRSAGSHSPADLICLRGAIKVPIVLAIQCQLDKKFSSFKIGELMGLAMQAGAFPLLAWREGRKIQFDFAEVK